jgi:uncharacterized iron-regulated membrane protein
MNHGVRKGLIRIHVWSGLTIGLLLLGVALTGAILAWRPQLEKKTSAALFTVTPGQAKLPADQLAAIAQAAHPGAPLESIHYYGDPTMPFFAYFSDKIFVHVNPYTGVVIGSRPRYGDFFGWLEGFHKFLHLLPAIGEPIMGTDAIVLTVVIVVGLVLWWPASRRALRAGLTVNGKLSGRPWHLNVHKVVGVYAALVLLASALTGIPNSLEWAKALLYPLTGTTAMDPPHPKVIPPGFAGFTAMAAQLDRLVPNAEESFIPEPKNGVVASYAVGAGAVHPYARSYLYLNPPDAAVLRFSPYAQASAGFRLYFWALAFHTGLIGGWPVQLILCLGALAVPALLFTGLNSYLKRKKGTPRRPGTPGVTAMPRASQTGS